MSRASFPAHNVRWHDGRLVGRVITNGPTYFAYDEEWLARGHNLSPITSLVKVRFFVRRLI